MSLGRMKATLLNWMGYARNAEAQVDEPRDAEDVEHRERSEKQPGEHQEHQLTALLHRWLVEPRETLEPILFRREERAWVLAHGRAF